MPGIETKSPFETPREAVKRQTDESLRFLMNNIKLNNDLGITKQPKLENGAAVFDYKYMGRDWEIVTRKEGNKYKIRIKQLKDGKWYTQKFGNKETFDCNANDKNAFNRQLGAALDKIIGKNRDRLPTTGGIVYDLLNPTKKTENNPGNKPENKPETVKMRNAKLDSQYEKQYGVTLIRDKKLTFYVVKKGEGLGSIRQKLSKIPEFSYLSNKYYDIPAAGTRNIHSFNTPNNSLTPGFYLPIPLKSSEREIRLSSFKMAARNSLNQMKNNPKYGDKTKELLKKVTEKEIVNIMAAYARSETAEDWSKFSDNIGSVELHRREPNYTAYSFSYYHILMGKGPGMNARIKLGLSEGDCYDATNACKLFLGYCFEKKADPTYFFNIKSLNDARKVGKTYNGLSSYGDKLRANLKHCRTIN